MMPQDRPDDVKPVENPRQHSGQKEQSGPQKASDEMSPEKKTDPKKQDKQQLSLWQLAKTGLAALLGVQSEANRKRDFSSNRPHHYIVLGVIAALVFVLVIVVVVQLVLKLVGA